MVFESLFKYDFSDRDKKKCLPAAARIMELSRIARVKGVILLEAEAVEEENLFLKNALETIIAGTQPETVKEVLTGLITAESDTGAELLEKLIVAEGVISIQIGENPKILEDRFTEIFDSKSFPGLSKALEESELLKDYYKHINVHKDKEATPDSLPFETRLLELQGADLLHVFMGIETDIIRKAISGCGSELVHKVLDCVSLKRCKQICENWVDICRDEVDAARQVILNRIDKLQAAGNISEADVGGEM